MSTDVDPLSINMLLKANNSNSNNNTSASEEDDSDAVGAQDQDQPEDWSKFGSLWSPHHSSSFKSYNDFMDLSDFSTSMSMSMDTDLGLATGMDYSYSSTMGIDPASLHFNPAAAGLGPGLGGGFGLAHDASTGFADSYGAPIFSFQQQPHHQQQTPLSTQGSASPESFTKDRRLSVTSSSSSVSGVSLSPMPDNYTALSSPPSGYTSDNVSTKDEPNPNSNSIADPEASNSNLYANDPAAELAHRVRQSAGMMLAVPVNGFGSSFQAGTNMSAGKLPIPRLNRPSMTIAPSYGKSSTTASLSSSSSTSSAASTPPPSTPPPTSHTPLNVTTSSSAAPASVPTPTTAAPRPKTSHTTIERRYRTNLNARIQSLRMAVPALRVLEDQDGSGKRIKKNIKGGVIVKGGGIGIGVECSEDGSVVDVIDERGFVDGVKVARKCSKANVLGKAVEYIRVLKRRERRLRAELAGVKVLVEGLVGGPALIREWEKQWRARFGGEEKDEEGEGDGDGDGEDEDSDDEDGDEGDEEGAGRKRKRARVAPTSTGSGISKKVDSKKKTALPVVVLAGEQTGNLPEKRKRGRPRKILPPPVTLEPVANGSAPVSAPPPALLPAAVIGSGSVKQDETMRPPEAMGQWQQQQQQSPQRFLLAVFALFSFFNSPLTSSSSMGRDHTHNHHHHTGKVLTPLHPPLVYSPEVVSQFIPPALSTAPTPVWKEYVQLFHLAVSFLVLASFVGNWFGFGFGVSGFRFSFEKRGWGWGLTSRRGKGGKGNEDRFAEERVLSGEAGSLSHFERLQIYRSISARENVSLNSLVSAAIALNNASGVSGGLARMKARAIWDDARRKAQGTNNGVKVTEEIVFGSMDVDEACERLADCVKRGDPDEMSDGEREYDLIEVLACGVVKEMVRSHLGSMFVDFVGEDEYEEGGDEVEQEGKAEEKTRRRRTVDASRELGGSVEEMGRLFERMWKIGVGGVDLRDVEYVFSNMHSTGGVDEEIRALFVALVLYARVFGDVASESSEETETERLSSSSDTVIVSSSSLLSPPPSPGTTTMVTSKTMNFAKRAKMMLELRRVLGCRVFEACAGVGERKVGGGFVEGLEEARDLVVDLIVDFERRDR